LTHTIEGSSGDLRLILSWDAVPGAFSYGVYYDEGTSVDENGYYRIAMDNEKTFTSELTEGTTYTFAVIFADGDGTNSPLSEPYTATFEAP
jgi:VCBS repeat-containing protein